MKICTILSLLVFTHLSAFAPQKFELDQKVGQTCQVTLDVLLAIDESEYAEFASKEFQNAALESAQESITLLKNKNDIAPTGKRLKRYTKIRLKSNETKTVKFTIHTSVLRFSDSDGNWVSEKVNFC